MAKGPVKKSPEFQIVERRDGRFAVRKRGGGFVNGAEKTKILSEAGKIKLSKPSKKEEAPAATEEPAADTAAPEAAQS
jgi:hypothetical protein